MNNEYYATVRNKYFDLVEDHSITVLFSGLAKQKTHDQDYLFEVNKNFYYLTGINQANVILVLVKQGNIKKEMLFVEANDEVLVKWVGKKLTKLEATQISGIVDVRYLTDFDSQLFSLLNPNRKVNYELTSIYLDLDRRNEKNYTTQGLEFAKYIQSNYSELSIRNAYQNIVYLRMMKTPEELAKITESIATTNRALQNVMKAIKPGLYEYQIETFYESTIKFEGNKDKAFDTICATGKNATILHYINNNTQTKEGDLILFDLGCRTDFYVSDISRTYPVSGTFTERQKEVYETVLDVNKKCIAFLKPGITWQELNEYANMLLAKGLKKLGLIQEDSELQNYYWHSIGHSIGLDTHDPTLTKYPILEGMVVTIEPGLYIEEESLGIRIEDNILITRDGGINLSKDIIKEVKDIEAFMKNR